MLSSTRLYLLLVFCLLLVFSSTVSAQKNSLITGASAGPVKIGMTVRQAQKLMPGYEFKRTSDGEGIALVAVEKNGKLIFTLFTGEEDPETKINTGKVIQQIEVWVSDYKTADGIGMGSTITEMEKVYGKLKEIMMSEIEAREYAEFAKKVKGLDFRVQGAGIYPKGARKTDMYRKGAKLTSIIISGDGTADNVGFFSDYTNLTTDCVTPKNKNEGGHVLTVCKGVGNYKVHMFDTAKSYEIQLHSGNTREFVNLASEALSWSPKDKKVEWRFKFGEPFAVIFRANEYAKDENGTIAYPLKKTGQYLYVKGLPGYSSIKGKVSVLNKNANVSARRIADRAYAKIQRDKLNKPFLNVDTGDYNLKIITAENKGETWVNSPMMIALKTFGDFSEMSKRRLIFEAPTGDGFTEFKMTVTDDGLLDDSVKAQRHIIKMKQENGKWRYVSIRRYWQCWPNRGHQNFSAVPCI